MLCEELVDLIMVYVPVYDSDISCAQMAAQAWNRARLARVRHGLCELLAASLWFITSAGEETSSAACRLRAELITWRPILDAPRNLNTPISLLAFLRAQESLTVPRLLRALEAYLWTCELEEEMDSVSAGLCASMRSQALGKGRPGKVLEQADSLAIER